MSSNEIDDESWILDLEDIEKDSGRLLTKKRMSSIKSKSDKHKFFAGNVLYSKLRPYFNVSMDYLLGRTDDSTPYDHIENND